MLSKFVHKLYKIRNIQYIWKLHTLKKKKEYKDVILLLFDNWLTKTIKKNSGNYIELIIN